MAAALTARPAVYVDASPGPMRAEADTSLRVWLVVRLLEEGYAIAPEPMSADVTLAVHGGDEGWTVDAYGRQHLRYRVSHGDPAVARLEILHRSVNALEEIAPETAEPSAEEAPRKPSGPTLVLHYDPAVPRDVRDATEPTLAEASLAVGATLSPGGEGPIALCVAGDSQALTIWVAHGDTTCAAGPVAATTLAEGAPLPAIDDALQAKLAAALKAPPPDQREETAEDDVEETEPEKPRRNLLAARPADEPPPPRNFGVRVEARGGLVARLAPVDPNLGAAFQIGRLKGPAFWADVQLWLRPSGEVQVIEAIPAIGLRWRFIPADLLALDIGGLTGILVHSWTLNTRQPVSPGADTRGTRFDFSAELATGLSVRIGQRWKRLRGLEITAGLRAGGAHRGRTHRIAGESAWARRGWRIGATAGLAYTWGAR